MYARGMSVAQVSAQIKDIYGFDVSEGMVTAITNKLLPEIEEGQKRPLSAVYPIVYIDAIVFNMRENNVIRKAAAYVILGLNEEGRKEVLSITIGENENAKFWLSVLNELKNRGVQDIFVLCADGLSGVKEAIAAAYPLAEYQRCIVHVVRNTLKYVADKDKKVLANDLKTIYHAPDEQTALARLDEVKAAWETKYPGCMNRWSDNWDCISPMFKFSQTARRVMYTTNAIESLNSGFRRLNRGRTIFPNAMGLLKALYLATWELTKKMDHARSKLGAGLCGIGYYVPRQADPELACQPGLDVGGRTLIDASLRGLPWVTTSGSGNHLCVAVPSLQKILNTAANSLLCPSSCQKRRSTTRIRTHPTNAV